MRVYFNQVNGVFRILETLSDRFAEYLIDLKYLRSEFVIDADSTKRISPAQTCKCADAHGRERDKTISRQGDFVTGWGFLSIKLDVFAKVIINKLYSVPYGKASETFSYAGYQRER